MKKRHSFLCLLLCAFVLLTSCSENAGPGSDPWEEGGVSKKIEDALEKSISASTVYNEYERMTAYQDAPEKIRIRPGQLTASAWDDNRYFEAFRSLFEQGETEEEKGRFASYVQNNWNVPTENRVKVSVTCGSDAVIGASVSCDGFRAVTDTTGVAYLFPKTPGAGTVTVTAGTETVTATFTETERDLAVSLASLPSRCDVIELMFVIDATGSMGDEMEYLKIELGDVIRRVTQNTQTQISLAFLFYRDDGDTEKFRYEDFRNVTNPADYEIQQAVLKEEFADGGGDTPEALDEALEIAVNKQWLSGATTKLIFHLFDAPAHKKDENKLRYGTAVSTAAEKGIRICPILASGADRLCEYLARAEAVTTGGTFIYITDHSAIGYEHLDPEITNAVVEYLNDCLVRIINGYHTGTFAPPISWESSSQNEEP